ncbi:MAG: amidotransferase [Gemmatimonadetes bacterium]|nr:amidotransferase [Gemmatimonadota bacterium]
MTRPFVLGIQHEPFEGLGTIADALEARGVDVRLVHSYAGDAVPREPGGAIGLVVMGGAMGVYDHPRLPYLAQEMRLIEKALSLKIPILGVCLGSQLLAQVLGADVRPSGIKEIGWFAVDLTDEATVDPLWRGLTRRFTAFHWHGDAFPLPPGAVHLASTDRCVFQAFRHGTTAYGIQFHLEVTDALVRGMVEAGAGELAAEGLDGPRIVAEAARFLRGMRPVAGQVFRGWAALLPA